MLRAELLPNAGNYVQNNAELLTSGMDNEHPGCRDVFSERAGMLGRGGRLLRREEGPPNGADAKPQAAHARERTSGAPLAARKERFCLSDLQAA